MGVAETRRAVAAASEAYKSFSKTTTKSRQDLLNRIFALINENADDLAKMVTIENGKPLADAKVGVISETSFVYHAQILTSHTGRSRLRQQLL